MSPRRLFGLHIFHSSLHNFLMPIDGDSGAFSDIIAELPVSNDGAFVVGVPSLW